MLGIEIGLNVVDERLSVFRAVVRMHSQTGTLVYEQEIFILIDDVEFCAATVR